MKSEVNGGASQIEFWEVSKISTNPRNSRLHSEEQVGQIAASIHEFGFNVPVLVEPDGCLIAGEGRLRAAVRLGMEMIPVIVLSHLTETQRRAYVIADNKIALDSTWNFDVLMQEFEELRGDIELSATGFSDKEIEEIRRSLDGAGGGGRDDSESDIAGDDAGGSDLKSYTMSFGSRKIVLTVEEYEALDALYVEYVDKFGIPAGFVRDLLKL